MKVQTLRPVFGLMQSGFWTAGTVWKCTWNDTKVKTILTHNNHTSEAVPLIQKASSVLANSFGVAAVTGRLKSPAHSTSWIFLMASLPLQFSLGCQRFLQSFVLCGVCLSLHKHRSSILRLGDVLQDRALEQLLVRSRKNQLRELGSTRCHLWVVVPPSINEWC